MRACPRYKGTLPIEVAKLLKSTLPFREEKYELKSRIAGLGSLGHPRILALATWHGAHIAREAKQLTPSAWIWARHLDTTEILSRDLVDCAVRIRDPHVHFAEHWIVRRLAPDCCTSKSIPCRRTRRGETPVLHGLGDSEHPPRLAEGHSRRQARLATRKDRWLHKAAKAMLKATLNDWKVWRRKWDGAPWQGNPAVGHMTSPSSSRDGVKSS